MTVEELLGFIKSNITNFTNPYIVENETAFHYTSHWEKIQNAGRFLGAPIDKNLDCTQTTLISSPAMSDPGVVFAYQTVNEAKEEGNNCDIIKIEYSKAIIANHGQENELDKLLSNYISNLDPSKPVLQQEPQKTVLILNTYITKFEKVL